MISSLLTLVTVIVLMCLHCKPGGVAPDYAPLWGAAVGFAVASLYWSARQAFARKP